MVCYCTGENKDQQIHVWFDEDKVRDRPDCVQGVQRCEMFRLFQG